MIYIILPAYNEQEALPPLLESISRSMKESALDYRAVVVNDGSVDSTPEVARNAAGRMPVVVVDHPVNMGLAEALRTGFHETLKHASKDDIIVTMDSDNTHPPRLIQRMVAMIEDGYDVVIASRYRKGAEVIGVPWSRRLLSHGASAMFRLFFPMKGVKDYTCGYRAYRAEVIRNMFETFGEGFISEQGFSCMVDVLLKTGRSAVKFGEVPLVLRYDMKVGPSKMKVAKTVLDTLKIMMKRLVRTGAEGGSGQ